jgi:hypothetical protein
LQPFTFLHLLGFSVLFPKHRFSLDIIYC